MYGLHGLLSRGGCESRFPGTETGRAGRRAVALEEKQFLRRDAEILFELQAVRGGLSFQCENRRYHPGGPHQVQREKIQTPGFHIGEHGFGRHLVLSVRSGGEWRAGVEAVLDSVLKIDHRRVFPKYAFGTFESWYKKNEAARQSSFPTQVSYFHGCYVNYNNPQLGKDLIKVMNALGVGVRLLDKEKCCGVALISNGFIEQAKKQAKVNIEAIRESVLAKNMPVIATSSTCAFTIRDEYPHLLSVDNADVREQVELATRYVYRLMARQGVKLKFKQNQKIRVAYHTPCHMEKLGWAYYSIELLKLIPNVELTVLDSQCCGIAGTYGFKKENYKTSQDIGESLFRQIEACDIDYVVTDCETCKWQIEMSTSKRCEHPISILAKALE